MADTPHETPERTSLLEEDWAPTKRSGEAVDASEALAAFQVLLSDYLVSIEKNDGRRKRMSRNVDHQVEVLREVHDGSSDPRQLIQAWYENTDREDRIGLLVEVLYLDPFAPNQVKYSEKDRRDALDMCDQKFGFEPSLGHLRKVSSEAVSAHRRRNWATVGLWGVGAGVLLATGGFVAAPLIGGALGAAAGLSGAAATAHGLAILGGGALAAGGAGVAGGMWLVAGTVGIAGATAAGGGLALYQLGVASATHELVKLQTTFKVALLETEADFIKAQQVLEDLHAELDTTREVLAQAQLVNDENSKQVKELEETVTALEKAIDWMEEAEADADGDAA